MRLPSANGRQREPAPVPRSPLQEVSMKRRLLLAPVMFAALTGFSVSAVHAQLPPNEPAVTISDVTVNEPDSGSVEAVFHVAVSTCSPIAMNWSTAHGTA